MARGVLSVSCEVGVLRCVLNARLRQKWQAVAVSVIAVSNSFSALAVLLLQGEMSILDSTHYWA